MDTGAGDQQTGFASSRASLSIPGAAAQSLGSANQHHPRTSSPKSCTTVRNLVTPILLWSEVTSDKGSLFCGRSLHLAPGRSQASYFYLKDSKLAPEWMINQL